jgi:hypothetical protein
LRLQGLFASSQARSQIRAAPWNYVVQSIAGQEEILGPDVTLAHLLLKNKVTDMTGRTAYALLTEPATRYLEIPLEGSVPYTEH